ncbi:hypothetical protein P7C73_g5782, partial [Tremellales sp. Uapishka_1]
MSIKAASTKSHHDHHRDEATATIVPADSSPAKKRTSIFYRGAYEKPLLKLPFYRPPTKVDKGPWLEEEHEATEWLSLFYDLVVVAVLSVFSTTHELNTPSEIGVYLSYFVVLSWVWVSQVQYDVRFQGEDVWHRIMKASQLMVFVYIGAASGNWNPDLIRQPEYVPDISDDLATLHAAADDSWTTVLLSFAISRVTLAAQYSLCAWYGKRAKRSVKPLWITVASLLVSFTLTIIAAFLPARSAGESTAKVVVFYLAIVVEITLLRIQVTTGKHVHMMTNRIANRYGAFTLIILGEGLVSIVRAFNRAISGLSESNFATYGQVFLSRSTNSLLVTNRANEWRSAITIMIMLWCFLFARFDQDEEISAKRNLLWQGIHLPLHFGLLLFIAAMVNCILVISFGHGLLLVSQEFGQTVAAIDAGGSNLTVVSQNVRYYLGRLELVPSYSDEITLINDLSQESVPTDDPSLLAYQYFGQILLQTSNSYGIELSEKSLNTLGTLYEINSTYTTNATLEGQRRDEASALLLEIIAEPLNLALSGTLWLFPTAGGVLILCAFRSMIWYHYIGIAHWVIHGTQIALGLAMALLGLLDIGKETVAVTKQGILTHSNLLYELINQKLPLVIVLVVYFAAYYGPLVGNSRV